MPKIIHDASARIRDAAAHLLADHGYEHVTIRRIARETGISVGTVYNYFSSKDEVVREVMLGDWEEIREEMRRVATSTDDLFTAAKALFALLRRFTETHRATWRLMSAENGARANAHLRYSPAKFHPEMEALVAALLERASPVYRSLDAGRRSFRRSFVARNLVTYAMENDVDYRAIEEVLIAPLAVLPLLRRRERLLRDAARMPQQLEHRDQPPQKRVV